MDFSDFSDAFLQEAQKVYSYNPDIPLQYRIVALLNKIYDYNTAKRFLEANRDYFQDKYMYLFLDSAIELCFDIVIDGEGTLYQDIKDLPKEHIYKPTPETLDYIEFLLQNGANPYLPEDFNQFEHIDELMEDASQQTACQFDCSEVKELLKKYS